MSAKRLDRVSTRGTAPLTRSRRPATGFQGLRPQPARSALARRRAYRRQHQSQLRGRRRALPARRRRSLRGCAERYRPSRLSRGTQPGRGVGVRIRPAQRQLASVAHLQAVRNQDQHSRRGACARIEPGTDARVHGRRPRDSSHGYRWLDYNEIDEKTEREHIRLGVETIRRLTGEAPVGWFNGRPSINTRRLLVEHGGFLYDRDYLGDELPFWTRFGKRHHLVIPTSFETNDNRFDRNLGFRTADGFARYMMVPSISSTKKAPRIRSSWPSICMIG